MHNIVIVGGNFAGASIAHNLLRHVLPLLNPLNSQEPEYSVTLVSPSSHTYFNIAAPRALNPSRGGSIDALFASIPDGFAQYPPAVFSFVQGEAVHVDEATQIISVNLTDDGKQGASVPTSLEYQSLIIATGTTSDNPLWKLRRSHLDTAAAFTAIRKAISAATVILVAGGGATGVETAGELGSIASTAATPPGQQICLLSGSDRLLTAFRHPTLHRKAENKLKALGVEVIHNLRVTSQAPGPDGKTVLTLSDQSTKSVDLYIDATGGRPNTGFLPPAWLNDRGRVTTTPDTLRATSAPRGVYAIGDVASYSRGALFDVTWAVPALAYSIWDDLSSANPNGRKKLKPKLYKQMDAELGMMPVGPDGGVGVLFGWAAPSWLVRVIKAKDYMIGKAGDTARGVGI